MRSSPTLLLAGLAAGLVACGGGTSSVRVTARDASADQALTAVAAGAYSEIFLDVVDIRVRYAGDDESWTDILDGTTTVDLLALQRGDMALLTTAEIAPGTITELRLVLAEGDQGHAINADGYFMPVRVPSGSTSGLKIKGAILVPEGEDVEIPLALDLDKALSVDKNGVLRIDPVIWLAEPTVPVEDPVDPGDGAGGDDGEGTGGTGGSPGTDPGPDPM